MIFNTRDTGFNVSTKIIHVEANSVVTIRVTNITSQVKFALIQVHHQTKSVCLAQLDPLHNELMPGDYVRGKDIGLIVSLEETNETAAKVWLMNELNQKLLVLLEVSLHTSSGE